MGRKDIQLLLVMTADERDRLMDAVTESYRIEWTESMEQAKHLIDEGNFQALILDEDLGPDWTSLSERAGEARADVPILVCTGQVGGKKLFRESRKDGSYIADLLIKPYSEEIVTERLAAALSPTTGREHAGATLPSHPLETGPAGG